MPHQAPLFGLALEKKIILLICVLAAIRIAFYASIFPFFNNTDELLHFDLVIKYGDGLMPRKMDKIIKTSAHYIAGCNSTEYAKIDTSKSAYPSFLQDLSDSSNYAIYAGNVRFWRYTYNFESGLSPAYYLLAGIWAKLGEFSGLFNQNSCVFLYWIRSFNLILIVLLVLIAHKIAKITFAEDEVLRIALPLFVAFLPQDTFYCIQNDNLSPIAFGLSLLCLLKFINADAPTFKQSIYLGLSMAFLFFVKISNLPVLIIALTLVFFKMISVIRKKNFGALKKQFAALGISAFLPITLLVIRNYLNFGDLTASAAKIKHLHWVYKPLSEWFNSDLLTFTGISNFWIELLSSFWRGETIWNSELLSDSRIDVFYWLSSLVFILLAIISLISFKEQKQIQILSISAISFASMLLFMIILSLMFSYGRSGYPSLEHPYFSSGRLISAVLLPFLILYLKGFKVFFSWIKDKKVQLFLLAFILLVISISEYEINKVALQSTCNLFSFLK